MYYLDSSEQARFGLAEPDDADLSSAQEHGEEQAEHSDFCPHCHAECQGDHTSDCPYFEEQPLPF